MSSTETLLAFHSVDAAYGPYKALFAVNLQVKRGTVVALVGANGAGKSTVARVASGLVRATSGTVEFDGCDVTRTPAWKMARLGVAHVPEGRSVFSTLTVEENLLVAFRHSSVGRRGGTKAMSRVFESFPRLQERRKQPAGTLSGGEQRMLAMARILAVPHKLLIADELSLGLAPVLVDEIYEMLGNVVSGGSSLLVVEQHLDKVTSIADQVILIDQGEVKSQGTVEETRRAVAGIFGPDSGQPDSGQPGTGAST